MVGADTPAPYLVERVRRALAEDAEIAELGIEVTVEAGRVLLRGVVATDARRASVGAAAERVLPGHAVENLGEVERAGRPDETETIA